MPVQGRHRGAILLKKGRYNISGALTVGESGVVLRGEGSGSDGTVLYASGTTQYNLITFTGNSSMTSAPSTMNVKDDYVPVGRFWVRVTNPQNFAVGDNVVLYRPGSEQWIKDLRMDQLDQPWTASGYTFKMERVVTLKRGDTLHFENPCVMALEAKYGGGAVYRYSYNKRLGECGVENMRIESYYAGATDNNHGWTAITFSVVLHGWVRNVKSYYFGHGLVTIAKQSKNITVENCGCYDAKSVITGGNRYSFEVNGSLNLVTGCESTEARHDCATGSSQAGPNVFTKVRIRNAHADSGPHHRWNMGTLYDNIDSDYQIYVQDRQNMGTGHGWAGANQVLWNCKARTVVVQNPWTSAVNFSIGTIATKSNGTYSGRPDGVWVSPGQHVSPASLYEAQLQLRKERHPGGVFSVQ
jgi:hypothetical protein